MSTFNRFLPDSILSYVCQKIWKTKKFCFNTFSALDIYWRNAEMKSIASAHLVKVFIDGSEIEEDEVWGKLQAEHVHVLTLRLQLSTCVQPLEQDRRKLQREEAYE